MKEEISSTLDYWISSQKDEGVFEGFSHTYRKDSHCKTESESTQYLKLAQVKWAFWMYFFIGCSSVVLYGCKTIFFPSYTRNKRRRHTPRDNLEKQDAFIL